MSELVLGVLTGQVVSEQLGGPLDGDCTPTADGQVKTSIRPPIPAARPLPQTTQVAHGCFAQGYDVPGIRRPPRASRLQPRGPPAVLRMPGPLRPCCLDCSPQDTVLSSWREAPSCPGEAIMVSTTCVSMGVWAVYCSVLWVVVFLRNIYLSAMHL